MVVVVVVAVVVGWLGVCVVVVVGGGLARHGISTRWACLIARTMVVGAGGSWAEGEVGQYIFWVFAAPDHEPPPLPPQVLSQEPSLHRPRILSTMLQAERGSGDRIPSHFHRPS